jgi:hypothetical protein
MKTRCFGGQRVCLRRKLLSLEPWSFADEVAKNTSTVSTNLMRDLMYRGADSAKGAHLLDSRVIFGLFGSKDDNEGVKSFFEKRPPNFQGKMPDDAPNVYPWWEHVNIASSAKASRTGSKL